jgi:hypothetical protein
MLRYFRYLNAGERGRGKNGKGRSRRFLRRIDNSLTQGTERAAAKTPPPREAVTV